MFVLVVDTSLMNVSISAVVQDLDTTVSGVQSAIALEALVSAAFILIGSKVGDLIGRKRAYVAGAARLRGRRAGDGARAEPDRDHRLLGGDRRPRRIAAAAGDAVADPRQLRGRGAEEGRTRWSARRRRSPRRSGRCSAGSSRPTCRGASASLLEVVVIAIVLLGHRAGPGRARTPAPRGIDVVGARALGRSGMGGVVLGILVWQEGGESVGALIAGRARSALAGLACWLVRRKREGKPTLLDPDLFKLQALPARDLPAAAPADRARRAR